MSTGISTWVVVPNFNGRRHLERCLPALLASELEAGPLVVIVVDDGSTDDSIAWLAQAFPAVKAVPNTGKKGFAGTANTGIRLALEAGADAVAVCNNDAQTHPRWLTLSLPALRQRPNMGLVGYVEVTPDRQSEFHHFNADRAAGAQARAVAAIPGCLMLFDSRCLRHVGLFDEDYYMYGEDNDMFLRIRHAGWEIAQAQVPVWHLSEGSSSGRPLFGSWLAYRNALRYALKNESPRGIGRVVLSLVRQGMNPFQGSTAEASTPSARRVRRMGPAMNAALLLVAGAWNLAHLRQTLRARRERTAPTHKAPAGR